MTTTHSNEPHTMPSTIAFHITRYGIKTGRIGMFVNASRLLLDVFGVRGLLLVQQQVEHSVEIVDVNLAVAIHIGHAGKTAHQHFGHIIHHRGATRSRALAHGDIGVGAGANCRLCQAVERRAARVIIAGHRDIARAAIGNNWFRAGADGPFPRARTTAVQRRGLTHIRLTARFDTALHQAVERRAARTVIVRHIAATRATIGVIYGSGADGSFPRARSAAVQRRGITAGGCHTLSVLGLTDEGQACTEANNQK